MPRHTARPIKPARQWRDSLELGSVRRVEGKPWLNKARFITELFMGSARRITLRIKPPIPFGDVTMVPAPLSGRPEADMARAMAAALADIEAPTAADVYNRLRQAFPLAPLSARVGALTALMERIRRPAH
jgi:hypothetical protein